MPVRREYVEEHLGDRFEIDRELGRGAMAVVYLASDRKLERTVALKVLRPEFALTVGGERFTQEVDILARLEHPNILPLLDAGSAGPVRFYVTPYAGRDLQTRINEEQQLSLDEALEITRQVAAALDHAHSQNVLHRDIKPANILFDGDLVLVCDFGIARAIERAGGDSFSSSGLIVGTPQYMSPEQARHDKKIDGRADVYSLASVVYEMLVGQPPFTGPTVQAVIARITKERPPRMRVVRQEVPEELERVVDRALSKRPRDRPKNASDFAGRLMAAR